LRQAFEPFGIEARRAFGHSGGHYPVGVRRTVSIDRASAGLARSNSRSFSSVSPKDSRRTGQLGAHRKNTINVSRGGLQAAFLLDRLDTRSVNPAG